MEISTHLVDTVPKLLQTYLLYAVLPLHTKNNIQAIDMKFMSGMEETLRERMKLLIFLGQLEFKFCK
jgi:hypothetical protein